ncbi:MAG TPA: type II toxin-antitoxin system RelE/ParE family toxin [Thermoplasmata archaeon]|nr:type II toxin-antitoxin system RelE/ParE family toxin [Thermoplasmata archaeon]
MPFEIIWSDSAIRQLRKLDRGIARRIFDKVGQLSENPLRWVRRMSGVSAYRLRVGDYRVLLDINEGELRVLVVEVGHRGSVYD